MTRLVVLLTWPPATWVLLHNADQLANYLGFYVGGYAAGKGFDVVSRGGKNAVGSDSAILETAGNSDSGGDDLGPRVQGGDSDMPKRKARSHSRGGKAQ